ncbi:TPA: tyrosine-type recombinase/integrase [Clostridium perfringens]|nr:integrase [Clostridium phage phiCp-D]
MSNHNEIITKIVGKYTDDLEEQLKLTNIIEEVLYNYDIAPLTQELVTSDLEEKIYYFIANKKLEGVSDHTIKAYRTELLIFARYFKKPVASITTSDLKMYLATQQHLKKSTIKCKIKILRVFFTWLQEEDYIIKNPSIRIKGPKLPIRVREGLTLEQLEIVREACIDSRERAVIEFIVSTGCRAEETVNVKIKDLDYINNSLMVIGKGDKQRRVFFSPKAKILIEKYLADRRGNSEYLFCASKKPFNKISVRSLELIINKIEERSGLKINLYPHLFRHTFCTLKANAGISMIALQSLMGHESLATTQRYFKIADDVVASEYKRLL